ncbi:hypothetical protein NPIL_252561 [Nephila pilipes]|uniref:Uncharacterized protein n=1 Tax=Nephila pilipes TaxID=299642 RepID=A0A8X6P247_NEPPI|nr:hypothetical protein NPIL_252561 [Nephila pilipes]
MGLLSFSLNFNVSFRTLRTEAFPVFSSKTIVFPTQITSNPLNDLTLEPYFTSSRSLEYWIARRCLKWDKIVHCG